MVCVHAFKPELEFERLLPERMPHWLEAALRFGMKPIETRLPSKAATAAADDEPLGTERDWQQRGVAGDSEAVRPIETHGRGLEALAIEGLTKGSTRVRTLHENASMPTFLTGDATASGSGVFGVDMLPEYVPDQRRDTSARH